jgi:hypothetical protein
MSILKKNVLQSWNLTRKQARELLDLYEKRDESDETKYRLPSPKSNLMICFPGNPNSVLISQKDGLFIVEYVNYTE